MSQSDWLVMSSIASFSGWQEMAFSFSKLMELASEIAKIVLTRKDENRRSSFNITNNFEMKIVLTRKVSVESRVDSGHRQRVLIKMQLHFPCKGPKRQTVTKPELNLRAE